MRRGILTCIVLSLTAATSYAASINGQGTWETTLQGRLPLSPGGTDYQAYYDTDLNITWLADANRTKTSGYDASGQIIWSAAQTWIGTLNTASYLGVGNWRLPTVTDTGTSGCDYAFSGTDCGANVDLSTGEMAHMFYSTLGNSSGDNTSGIQQPCATAAPNFCLRNTGPFSNLQPYNYWSGTDYAPDTSYAWRFLFVNGRQIIYLKAGGLAGSAFYAWAVRPGDISAVPIPASAWLLGTGLAGLVGRRMRRSAA